MPIQMQCPHCRAVAALPDGHAGRPVRCKRCQAKFTIPSDAGATPGLPAAIDRYLVRELLGAGTFGAVYRAFDPRLERDVALKVLKPEMMASAQAVERFLREAKAAAKLLHPHIVPVYDAGRSGDVYYIASAFIRGMTLASAVPDEGGLEPRRAAALTAQLALALGEAHRQGILHRDVKPANAMLDEQGSLHLMDFGLAGWTQEETKRLTRLGAVMGTPAYMAPEQAGGDTARVGPASDLYGAGVVLYELLTSRLPFEGGHPVALAYQILHGAAPPPSQHRPGLDTGLEAICLKAMAKRPADRFASGEEMAAALARWAPAALPLAQPLAAPPLARLAKPTAPPAARAKATLARPALESEKATIVPSSGRPTATPPLAAAVRQPSVFDRETVVPRTETEEDQVPLAQLIPLATPPILEALPPTWARGGSRQGRRADSWRSLVLWGGGALAVVAVLIVVLLICLSLFRHRPSAVQSDSGEKPHAETPRAPQPDVGAQTDQPAAPPVDAPPTTADPPAATPMPDPEPPAAPAPVRPPPTQADDRPPPDPALVAALMKNPFAGRAPGELHDKLMKYEGGTDESEAAVARGLRWLALHQAPDGHWSLDHFERFAHQEPRPDAPIFADACTGQVNRQDDIAATGFALLPFLGAGHTHRPLAARREGDPDYSKTVKAGLNYLSSKQGQDGYFGGSMYSHAIATIAFCEAYGMTYDPMLKGPALKAIRFIEAAQDPTGGGWRYSPRTPGDLSVTGWQVTVLKSAQMAGLEPSNKGATLKQADKFLDSAETSTKGGYGYMPGNPGTVVMTAVGSLCRQYRGVSPRNPGLLAGVDQLKTVPPGKANNIYYEYYAAQVMHHMDGDAWDFWNEGPKGKGSHTGIRDTLIARQCTTAEKVGLPDATPALPPRLACEDGSWDPTGAWGEDGGGRIMYTSLSLVTLEVYYRYPPLYWPTTADAPPDKPVVHPDNPAPPSDKPAAPPEVPSVLAEIGVPPINPADEAAAGPWGDLPPFAADKMAAYADGGDMTDLRNAVRNARAVIWATSNATPPVDLAEDVQKVRTDLKVNLSILRDGCKKPADEAKFQDLVRKEQLEVSDLMNLCDDAQKQLTEADAKGGVKTRRWQANYDFILARLQEQYAYLFEYASALGQMRKQLPDLAEGQNGWKLAPQETLHGDSEGKRLAKAARKLLDKIIADNPDTPWEFLAKREKQAALGLQWQGAKID